MAIEDERRALASELAPMLGEELGEVDRAILAQYERPVPSRRNLVSVLASAAHLGALLRAMPCAERTAWLQGKGKDGRSRLDRILGGDIAAVTGDLADELAGPYQVSWDGNWPNSVARARLRGRMPAGVRPGDTVVGGDGEGDRIDIRVIEDEDGVLTGDLLNGTWRDPPHEDVWTATYNRLAGLYPDEVPPPGGREGR